MPKLSPRIIDAIEAGDADRVTFDAELPGFAIKVTPKGARVFLYQYWSPVERGKRRRVTIGNLGAPLRRADGSTVALTAHTARVEATRLAGLVSARRDPFLDAKAATVAEGAALAAERVRTSALRPMRDIARDFLAEREADGKSAVTVREYRRLIGKHFAAIGARPAAEIGTGDADAIRRQKYTVTLKGKTLERSLVSRPILANRVQQLGKALVNYAERIGARPRGEPNPFDGPRWHVEHETRSALTRHEITALHTALDAVDDGTRGGGVDAIRFLLYSGWRKREALTLRWDAVEGSAATLGQSKTGRSVRPLSRQARSVLDAIPRRGPYVFSGRKGASSPREGIVRTWNKVRQLAGITKPLHSLRHTVATVALSEGVSLAVIGAILGHASASTTARYAKLEGAAALAGADVAGKAIGRGSHQMRPKKGKRR